MKSTYILFLILVLVLGCKMLFFQSPVTALALPFKSEMTTKSVVFIAGFDEGDNSYYSNAKTYFEAKMPVIDSLFSMEEIITWLNQNATENTIYNEIHIVSHSNAWLGMSLKTTKTGERITVKNLQKAKQAIDFPKVKNGITNGTKIIFHSCGLGENRELLNELKMTFSNSNSNLKTPFVYASTLFNVFGGKFAGHYLAKPYYVFYPTAESKGPAYLKKGFEKAYPDAEIDWLTAMKTKFETTAGTPYSYKFNIPVEWEFSFENTDDIPELANREAILDWISESPVMAATLFELNIPLEKYRWRSEIKGKKLRIKGKTTVLCVLAPVLQDSDNNEYRRATVDDTLLYQIL